MLLDLGYQVSVHDDLSTGRREYLEGLPREGSTSQGGPIECVEGDILDVHLVNHAVPGHDGIVRLAAEACVPGSLASPRQTYEVNFVGTLNLSDTFHRVVGETRRHRQRRASKLRSSAARERTSKGAEEHR